MTIDHLSLKLLIFVNILQVLRFDFKKFRILEILNFHPWYSSALQIRLLPWAWEQSYWGSYCLQYRLPIFDTGGEKVNFSIIRKVSYIFTYKLNIWYEIHCMLKDHPQPHPRNMVLALSMHPSLPPSRNIEFSKSTNYQGLKILQICFNVFLLILFDIKTTYFPSIYLLPGWIETPRMWQYICWDHWSQMMLLMMSQSKRWETDVICPDKRTFNA